MSKGKYRKSNVSKVLMLLVALILVIGCTVGGTLAWLTATTGPVTNTFVVGDIGDLTLTETDEDKEFAIIPGMNITKDPKVSYSYDGNNEAVAVYVFVKVEAEGWDVSTNGKGYSIGGDLLKWNVAPEWKVVPNTPGVYYQEVAANGSLTDASVITNNTITVSSEITKDDVATVVEKAGDITFTAYAIQKDGFGSPKAAWTAVSAADTSDPSESA